MSAAAESFLRLCAERIGGRTVLIEVHQTAPFHVGPPSYRRGPDVAEVILQQVGPGVLPGDDLWLDITVGAGARLIVRGQSATKLYRCPPGEHARTRARIQVETGGWLAWLPGPLIPFRHADYLQETEVALDRDARLAMADIITPGRMAMGESSSFRRLDLRLRLCQGGRLILAERSLLDPERRPLARAGRHGPFDCAGTMYLCGLDLGPGDMSQRSQDLWWDAGDTGSLTVMRLLGTSAQVIAAAQEAAFLRAWETADPPRPEAL